jgi:hypothetical protein
LAIELGSLLLNGVGPAK